MSTRPQLVPIRRSGASPVRLRRLGSALVVVALMALGITVGGGSTNRAAAAETAPVVIDDPTGSGMSVTVDPGDLSVAQGDIVHLHFAGLEPGEYIYSLGTCPGGLDQSLLDTPAFVGQLACSSRLRCTSD